MRHFAASVWVEQGLWRQPKRVQQRLGHADWALFWETYSHLFEAHEEDIATAAQAEADILGNQ